MDATIYDMAVSPIPWDVWLFWLLPLLGCGVLLELLDQKLKKRKHGKTNSGPGNKVTEKDQK